MKIPLFLGKRGLVVRIREFYAYCLRLASCMLQYVGLHLLLQCGNKDYHVC